MMSLILKTQGLRSVWRHVEKPSCDVIINDPEDQPMGWHLALTSLSAWANQQSSEILWWMKQMLRIPSAGTRLKKTDAQTGWLSLLLISFWAAWHFGRFFRVFFLRFGSGGTDGKNVCRFIWWSLDNDRCYAVPMIIGIGIILILILLLLLYFYFYDHYYWYYYHC